MTLDTLVDEARGRQATITVYAPTPPTDLEERLGWRDVTVEHRPLPGGGPDPFVTIREAGAFRGALALSDVERLLAPPIVRPGETGDVSPGYRALFAVLDDTVFTTRDRRRLVGASREIEDRAKRVGAGTLRVSFQRLSAFRAQAATYRRLVRETELTVHVYGAGDWTPPAMDGVTYHETTADAVERFWVVAFDGGPDEFQACGLVARETAGEYTGFWTYDPDTVAEMLTALEATED